MADAAFELGLLFVVFGASIGANALRFEMCAIVHHCPVKFSRMFAVKGSFERKAELSVSNFILISKKMVNEHSADICLDENARLIERIDEDSTGGIFTYPR